MHRASRLPARFEAWQEGTFVKAGDLLDGIVNDEDGQLLLERAARISQQPVHPAVAKLKQITPSPERSAASADVISAPAGVGSLISRARRAVKSRGSVSKGDDGIARRQLSPRALDLLAMVRCEREPEGWALFGPEERIPDWPLLKQTIDSLGARWRAGRARKPGSFYLADTQIDAPAPDAIRALIERGWWLDPKANGFFPTQPQLASEVVRVADIRPRMRVLEPSAGVGHLAREIIFVAPDAALLCIELLPEHRQRLSSSGFRVFNEPDFLKVHPDDVGRFDRIVMNPPFGVGGTQEDIDHVLHALAFLRPEGRLVAIMSNGVDFRQDKKTLRFREQLRDRSSRCTLTRNAPDAFVASGTGVQTVTLVVDVASAA